MKVRIATLALGLALGAPAYAEPALGLWLTEPDKKGQVAHVEVTRCAEALCGEIVKTLDAQGNSIAHPNIGKRVFWGMTPTGAGQYEGRAFVPAHNKEYAGRMTLAGNRLDVGGCYGPICLSQEWTRLR